MEYQIVAEESTAALESAVDARIKEGWEPLGGVAVTESYRQADDQFYPTWAQAMAKRDKPGE